METALTLLDATRPVFPLDIVRTLRDQRAMMVQTTVQTSRPAHLLHITDNHSHSFCVYLLLFSLSGHFCFLLIGWDVAKVAVTHTKHALNLNFCSLLIRGSTFAGNLLAGIFPFGQIGS